MFKPQFTEGRGLLPLCSLKTAVVLSVLADCLLAAYCLLTSASIAAALGAFYISAFWLNWAVLVGLALVCAVARSSEQRTQAQKQTPELEEADLRHLGSEIRPHFFFNALNAVMGLIRINPKQAEAVLQDTAELFRSVMAQHEQRLVTLHTELDTCQQYTRIEQARLAQRLVVEWHIDAALLGVSVPPFSLQPLIENAIRHGIEPLAKGGTVQVSVQRFEQQLVLRVTNPVLSELDRYSATKAFQHNGIALDNIAKRLALMYDQAAQFDHGIVEGRYEAQISLPLEFEP